MRKSSRSARTALRSPGRPPVGWRVDRCCFWAAFARGLYPEAAVADDQGIVGLNRRLSKRVAPVSPSTYLGCMTAAAALERHRAEVLRLAAKHGATDVRVFGSVARGDADESSDIDFLVQMSPGRSLFDLGGLLMDLQDLLERRVGVVTERGLRPRMRERVLRDAVPV